MRNQISSAVKKVLSLFPPTWPYKTYNTLLKVPLLKGIMTKTVLALSPDHIDLPEGRVIFDPDDPVLAGGVALGSYEPETVACFRSCLKKDMTVVDIGANLGYFTVIAAGTVGPSGKVLAYEPDPHNFALLTKNITVNGFKNVTASAIALSDRAGTHELFSGDNQCTLSFGDKKGTGHSKSVQTDTLDASLKALGTPKVDLIKMDIEGAEPMALAGMKETLSRNLEIIVLFECYPNAIKRLGYSPLGFLEDFRRLGFTIISIDEDHGAQKIIDDLPAYITSFPTKDASRNLLAVRKPQPTSASK